MNRKLTLALLAVGAILVGVALASWRVFPTEDMIARATCAECHDVHAAIEYEDVPFQSQVWILGDVPEATYFIVSDLFPYAQQEPNTSISLPDLLAEYGVTEWGRVAIESLDGGIVIFDREYVSQESLLVPYAEGIRFKDENQHESTWLKGVRWIVVVGDETPLSVAGEETSMGRLLLQDRTTVVAEGGDAIYTSPLDGEIYRGEYAHTYTGARLSALLQGAEYDAIQAVAAGGKVTEYARDDVGRAIIATVNGRPSLLLPEAGRSQWVLDLTEVRPLLLSD